jgi:hypothetical protein
MGQTNGVAGFGVVSTKGESPRLDLDLALASAAERRVVIRRGVREALVEEMDFDAGGVGAWQDIPANTVTAVALSMYFSIKRSLFQFI